jgi:hypothetical protein
VRIQKKNLTDLQSVLLFKDSKDLVDRQDALIGKPFRGREPGRESSTREPLKFCTKQGPANPNLAVHAPPRSELLA